LAAVLFAGAPFVLVLWFFGIAGLLVGCASLFVDLTWQLQFVTFAVSGFSSAVLWQQLDRSSRDRSDPPSHSVGVRSPCALIGRVFRLQKPIVDGTGVVTIGGVAWRVPGRDCAAGKRVKVIQAEGTLLIVDPLETG
jgi:membrane protein implicated in regulation of membrane protease activity